LKDDDFKNSFRSSLKNTTFHAKYYHKLTQHGGFNLEDETFSLQRNLELRVPFPYADPGECVNKCKAGRGEDPSVCSRCGDVWIGDPCYEPYRDIAGDEIKNYLWFNGKEATLIKREGGCDRCVVEAKDEEGNPVSFAVAQYHFVPQGVFDRLHNKDIVPKLVATFRRVFGREQTEKPEEEKSCMSSRRSSTVMNRLKESEGEVIIENLLSSALSSADPQRRITKRVPVKSLRDYIRRYKEAKAKGQWNRKAWQDHFRSAQNQFFKVVVRKPQGGSGCAQGE